MTISIQGFFTFLSSEVGFEFMELTILTSKQTTSIIFSANIFHFYFTVMEVHLIQQKMKLKSHY